MPVARIRRERKESPLRHRGQPAGHTRRRRPSSDKKVFPKLAKPASAASVAQNMCGDLWQGRAWQVPLDGFYGAFRSARSAARPRFAGTAGAVRCPKTSVSRRGCAAGCLDLLHRLCLTLQVAPSRPTIFAPIHSADWYYLCCAGPASYLTQSTLILRKGQANGGPDSQFRAGESRGARLRRSEAGPGNALSGRPPDLFARCPGRRRHIGFPGNRRAGRGPGGQPSQRNDVAQVPLRSRFGRHGSLGLFQQVAQADRRGRLG